MAEKRKIIARIKGKRTMTRSDAALKEMTVNGGKVPLAKALRAAGYSENYARNPHKFKNTKKYKDFQSRLADVLSDDILAEAHSSLLKAHRVDHAVFPLSMTDEMISDLLLEVGCVPRRFMHGDTQNHCWFWSPDNKAKKDAVDMAYKIRDKYPSDKIDLTMQRPFGNLSDEELSEYIRERKKFLLKK